MSKPDWSNAPEDATHYHPQDDGYVEHWFKPGHFCVLGFESDGWRKDPSGHTVTARMVARPDPETAPKLSQAAFPSPGVVLNPDGHNPQQQGAYEGMSLRDYLAAKAMNASLSACSGEKFANQLWGRSIDLNMSILEVIALDSYALADAMLAERAK